jgi:hypothetical protein
LKKTAAYLVTLLIFAIAGVGVIKHESKPFLPDTYYVGDQADGGIDYKSVYNTYRGSSFESITSCDKASKQLPTNYRQWMPTKKNLLWFWAVQEINDGLLKSKTDSNKVGYTAATLDSESWYMWEVPASTYLIAIGNATLEADSQYSDTTYPDNTYTRGVYLTLIVKTDTEAFRVSYGSMLQWWCCMNKKEPDSYQSGKTDMPRYGHTVSFTDSDSFYSGSVIGIAGRTGMPLQIRDTNKSSAYLLIKIEKCTINDDGNLLYDWSNSTLEELYDFE